MMTVEQAAAEIDRQGFALLENLIDADLRERLDRRLTDLFELEGEEAGSEFRTEPGARRLANLVSKGDVFLEVVGQPFIVELMQRLMGEDFKYGSLNARSAYPNSAAGQPLHVDMGWLPDEKGPKGFNTVWMLDDFTVENGALRVIPGTHRCGKRPGEVLEDPLAAHPEEITATGRAGSVLAFNCHLWHGARPNGTSGRRLALNSFYCRGDQPQQLWQKKHLSAAVQERLSPELRRLLALDDPRNDELSANPGETSGFMKRNP